MSGMSKKSISMINRELGVELRTTQMEIITTQRSVLRNNHGSTHLMAMEHNFSISASDLSPAQPHTRTAQSLVFTPVFVSAVCRGHVASMDCLPLDLV
jgi:hypothetical protein